jgi:uroporphyrinogen-III synthase
MQALITRPVEDAASLAAAVSARGLVPLIEPLLQIRPLPGAALDLAGVQAVLFTSANGARAFAEATPRRDLRIFAVGDQTAETARRVGFTEIASAGGDVADLAALVEARLAPAEGALLHAAGSVTAGDLAGRLGAAGFTLRRAVLYAAEPVSALSAATQAALRDGAVGLAFFFSPRTASSFVNLAKAASLGAACGSITAFCLSQAVATVLAPLGWRDCRIADAPRQTELLAALDRFLAARSASGRELDSPGIDSPGVDTGRDRHR